MKEFLRRRYDRAVFALTLLAAAASTGWAWREQAVVRRLQREAVRSSVTGPVRVLEPLPVPGSGNEGWADPTEQSRGAGWLFELFSPPAISLDPGTHAFAVAAPAGLPAQFGGTEGLELRAVRREPYRLQLAGYFGAPDDYVGTFTCPLTTETLLARPGHRFESLGLTLKSFDVRPVAAGQGSGWEMVAQAVIREEETGVEVLLDSRTRRLTDALVAEVSMPGAAGGARELHEGDTLDAGAYTYRVDRVQFDPPEVLLARVSPGTPGEKWIVVRLGRGTSPKIAPPKTRAPRAASDVAAATP